MNPPPAFFPLPVPSVRLPKLARLAALLPRSARLVARAERGAAVTEYALLLGAIALLCVVGAARLGQTTHDGAILAATYTRSL